MTNKDHQICSKCNIRFVMKDVYDTIQEEFNLCLNCLEEGMQNGEVPDFSMQQMELVHQIFEEENENSDDEQPTGYNAGNPNQADDRFKEDDLTLKEMKGELNPFIGRAEELNEILMILSRKYKSNPLILGEPGVGKTSIIEGLAAKINNGEVPHNIRNHRIIKVDIGELLSGTKFRGELEAKISRLIKEVEKMGNIILFIDEFHMLTESSVGGDNASDLANLLKPHLTSKNVKIIGATTFEEYRRNIERDAAFARRFQVVTLNEPSVEETLFIVKGMKDTLEKHHQLTITDEAIKYAIDLSNRYITDRYQPDKTIDLLDEASSLEKLSDNHSNGKSLTEKIEKLQLEKIITLELEDYKKAKKIFEKEKELRNELNKNTAAEKNGDIMLHPSYIEKVIQKRTGIPVTKLVKSEKEKLSNLEQVLKKEIKGQDRAVEEVARFVKKARVNLKDPNRPNGVFLFLGPTGVGKTELSKVLAEELFGSKDAMIRIDMGEFMEKHDVSKLIGAPPGYIGHNEGGKLTNLLRKNPYSIVLLDEVEKAHPEVMNVMLHLFEDGVLTDNKGRTVDAKNAIFILTSNAGSEAIYKKQLGFFKDELKNKENESRVMNFIYDNKLFKPEFLNRIDSVVVFNELNNQTMKDIVIKLLDSFKERVDRAGYKINIAEEVIEHLARDGYQPQYGARDLKRKIEKIGDLLANNILENEKEFYDVFIENNNINVK